MTPRLVAVAGPLQGTLQRLSAAPMSIGREPGNDIVTDDRSVSRRHCVLEISEGVWRLRDLGSHNHTYLNGHLIEQAALYHGDRITVGKTEWLFLTEDDDPPHVAPAPDEDATAATVVLRLEDAVYLSPEKAVGQLAGSQRAQTDLRCLLQMGEIISAERRLGPLATRILNLIGETLPVDDAAILLTAPNLEEARRQFTWTRKEGHEGRFDTPRSVIQRVLKEGVALWTSDVERSGSFDPTASVLSLKLRAMLAVPLVCYERVTGVLYAAAASAGGPIDQQHLQLLTGVAGLVAGSLDTAVHLEELERDNQRLLDQVCESGTLVGESPRMQAVRSFVAKVAPAASTVLITGESGTGKELVSRALHRNSPRASKPFVAINCAAITETLLESELFGHERGAFTGAVTQKRGKLEEADGGTVFLDEVGELAPTLQAKMLRVLQEREFERVGGNRTVRVDIRVVAATNRNLAERSRSGDFRQDLFYRLNVVSVHMPALRERREDIALLAGHFLRKHSAQTGRQVKGIAREALAALSRYEWPGNVRELENAIERAIVLGSTDTVLLEDLPESVLETAGQVSFEGEYHELVNAAKRQIVLTAIERANGNYAEAARQLGIHPNNLHRLIRSLSLRDAVKK